MIFSKCKVCSEKDRRIADLKEQISLLKSLVSPSNDPNTLPIVHREADAILSAQQDMLEADDSAESEMHEIESERESLLNGTY